MDILLLHSAGPRVELCLVYGAPCKGSATQGSVALSSAEAEVNAMELAGREGGFGVWHLPRDLQVGCRSWPRFDMDARICGGRGRSFKSCSQGVQRFRCDHALLDGWRDRASWREAWLGIADRGAARVLGGRHEHMSQACRATPDTPPGVPSVCRFAVIRAP